MSDTKPTIEAVTVPKELLRQLRHYTICHLIMFPTCGAPTEAEIDSELAAIKSQPVPLPTGYTDIKDYIAEQEKDPVRKAALDEARVRLREELAKGPVPVEPEQIKMMRYDEPEGRSDYERAITEYIDSLQFALQLAQQERGKALKDAGMFARRMNEFEERAEKAEASNKRLVELLRNPTDAMIAAGFEIHPCKTGETKLSDAFKAMSAELLREVDNGH